MALRSLLLLAACFGAASADGETKEELLAKFEKYEREAVEDILRGAPQKLKVDPDVILAAMAKGGCWMLKQSASELRKDKAFMLRAVKQQSCALQHGAPTMQADRDVVLAAATEGGWSLRHADKALLADREIALAAVSSAGSTLSLFAEEFQADRELVLAAAAQACDSLQYAQEALRSNKELMMEIVTAKGDCIEFAAPALKADAELMAAAVPAPGYQLLYGSDELKADPELVMAELRGVGKLAYGILADAPESIRGDKEVVTVAVAEHGHVLKFASEELQADEDVVLAAVRQDPDALRHAADGVRAGNKELVLAALASPEADSYGLLKGSNTRLRQDREVMAAAVARDGSALAHASAALQADKALVLEAVRQKGIALQYAAESMRDDKEVVEAALAAQPEENPQRVLRHASAAVRAALSGGALQDRDGQQFRLLRKVKLTQRAPPHSTSAGKLPKGEVITVLESEEVCPHPTPTPLAARLVLTRIRCQYEGEERVRCEAGWLSTQSASGRENLERVKGEL